MWCAERCNRCDDASQLTTAYLEMMLCIMTDRCNEDFLMCQEFNRLFSSFCFDLLIRAEFVYTFVSS